MNDDENATSPDDDTTIKTYGDEANSGALLTKKGKELAKLAHDLWKAQNPLYNRRMVEYRVNERRRNGDVGVWVGKKTDLNQYEVRTAPGLDKTPIPMLNLNDRYCQRLTSQLHADDYQIEVEPERGDDQSEDAGEVSQRALDDEWSEGKLNAREMMIATFDLAHTGGSGYLLLYVDNYAGGRQPVSVEASPLATHVDNATIDPQTKQAYPDRHPVTQQPAPLTNRYVAPDGALQDQKAGAALQWMPRLDAETYHARHIRFLPWDSENVWQADGVMIGEYTTVGKLKARYRSQTEQFTDVQWRQIAEDRITGWTELLPQQDGRPQDRKGSAETPIDDLLCAHLCLYYQESAEYPDGCYVTILGKDTAFEPETWIGQDEAGRFRLDLPLVQVKQWRRPGYAHGVGTLDLLGDGSEARALVWGMMFDYLDKVNRRKIFIPSNSILNGQEYLLDALDVLQVNPGGAPIYEEIPEMNTAIPQMEEAIKAEMQEQVVISETSQALETPDAQSGRAKLAVISQVHANMSDLQKNIQTAHVRLGRLMLQQMRKYYTKEQEVAWTGEDGAYQVERWKGSDLAGVKDVKIKAGTGTMMPPLQKIEQAMAFQQAGIAQLPEILDVIGKNVSSVIGIRDNPHRQRVRRQIAGWEKGPQGPPPPPQPVMVPGPTPPPAPSTISPHPAGPPHLLVQPGAQPQPPMVPQIGPDGMPVMQDVPDPAAMQLFLPNPVDAQPDVAQIRLWELGRALASLKYEGFPKSWQLAIDQAYQMAVQATMPPPPPMAGPPGQPPPSGAPDPNQPPPFSPTEQGMMP